MKSVYKYVVEGVENIEAPIIQFISAGVQNGKIVVWAEVDTDKPNRNFLVAPIGTGWDLDTFSNDGASFFEAFNYLNTVQLLGGALIFHVYYMELTPNEETKKTGARTTKVAKYGNEASITVKNSMINMDALSKLI